MERGLPARIRRPRRPRSKMCLFGVIGLVGLLLPGGAHGQQADSQIEAILANMVVQKGRFQPDELHRLGVPGLSAVLDELLPETAEPKKVDLPNDTISRLIKRLGDDNFRVRESAFERLYRLGRGAEALLTEATESDDAEIGWRARRILRKWESELTEDKARYMSAFAVYAAGIRDDACLEELLRRTLAALETGMPSGGKQQILGQCMRAVARSGKDELTDRLKPLLKHNDVRVAVLVIRSVGSVGGNLMNCPALLLDALKSDQQQIVVQAISSVTNCRENSRKPEIKRLLISIFQGGNERLKFHVSFPLMYGFGYPPAVDFLLKQAQSEDPNTRIQALSLLADSRNRGKPADEKVLKALTPLLKSEDHNTRRRAARALGNYTGEEVVKRLIPLLCEKNNRDVYRKLMEQPDKKMLRRLLAAAAKDSPDEKVRKIAASMVEQLPKEDK